MSRAELEAALRSVRQALARLDDERAVLQAQEAHLREQLAAWAWAAIAAEEAQRQEP